jgi:RNA polymerase sigma-70 factor (ECF subfamily)
MASHAFAQNQLTDTGVFSGLARRVSVPAAMDVSRSTASDAMARYADGDAAAFGVLYAELAPALARYLKRTVRDPHAVGDLLQQAFMQLHLSRGRFLPGARVEPWAYSIARAVAMDFLRRDYRRRGRELDDEHAVLVSTENPLDGVAAGEIGEALRAELAALSPKLREAFLLVRVDGLSHAEAAEVLGIEESATKVRTHRATGWLRDKLARFRPKEGP